MTRLRRLVLAGTLLGTLALSGCADDEPDSTGSSAAATPDETSSSPTATPEPTSAAPSPSKARPPSAAATVAVRIDGDSVTPVADKVEIGIGETIELRLDSDRAGEMHVHSTPEQTFDFGGGRSRFEVRLDRPGSVDIEEHVSGVLLVRVLVR